MRTELTVFPLTLSAVHVSHPGELSYSLSPHGSGETWTIPGSSLNSPHHQFLRPPSPVATATFTAASASSDPCWALALLLSPLTRLTSHVIKLLREPSLAMASVLRSDEQRNQRAFKTQISPFHALNVWFSRYGLRFCIFKHLTRPP